MRRISCAFAFAVYAVDPGFALAAFRAFRLYGGHQKFGHIAGLVGAFKPAFQPGQEAILPTPAPGLKFRDNDHFEFETFRLMDAHQLHAIVAACRRIRERIEIGQSRIKTGAEKVYFAIVEHVNALPQQFEVCAPGGVNAICSSQA